ARRQRHRERLPRRGDAVPYDRAALASAQSGDTIKVVGGRQLKYHETVHLVASTTLTFVGGYDAGFSEPPDPVSRPTVIDAQKHDRIFTIIAGAGETIVVTVDGFTMRKGFSTTNLITEFCCIGKGGGIAALADTGGLVDLTVRNSIVTKCRSDDSAGGIVVIGFAGGVATVHLSGVTVTRNRAPYG